MDLEPDRRHRSKLSTGSDITNCSPQGNWLANTTTVLHIELPGVVIRGSIPLTHSSVNADPGLIELVEMSGQVVI